MSLRLSATLERDAVCATEPTGGLAWLRLRLHNADDPTWPIEVCWRLPGSGYATQFVAHRLAGSMRKGQRVTVYASDVMGPPNSNLTDRRVAVTFVTMPVRIVWWYSS